MMESLRQGLPTRSPVRAFHLSNSNTAVQKQRRMKKVHEGHRRDPFALVSYLSAYRSLSGAMLPLEVDVPCGSVLLEVEHTALILMLAWVDAVWLVEILLSSETYD